MVQMTDTWVEEESEEQSDLDSERDRFNDRKLITAPYDLVIESLLSQIAKGTLHLRPLSDRPSFQRRYVWKDELASRLIESILLNVPIPPCYLSQNRDFELDVIDGQQRIYSIYRFLNNQFELAGLKIFEELNGRRFHTLAKHVQRKLETYTLRCIVVTNESSPEIKFDVFERLNSNTVPLNPQELRNCIHRGALIDLVNELATYKPWLGILNRTESDPRMKTEELVLRFFAFFIHGLGSYRTPQKYWLNHVAESGRKYPVSQVSELAETWKGTIDRCLIVFDSPDCFRREVISGRRAPVNRALMDLMLQTISRRDEATVAARRDQFRSAYFGLLADSEFSDLVTRAIDHKSRTKRRFQIWQDRIDSAVFG